MSAPPADEFQALSDTLYHWSVFEPSVKCEIGCTAFKAGERLGGSSIPMPLAEPAGEKSS